MSRVQKRAVLPAVATWLLLLSAISPVAPATFKLLPVTVLMPGRGPGRYPPPKSADVGPDVAQMSCDRRGRVLLTLFDDASNGQGTLQRYDPNRSRWTVLTANFKASMGNSLFDLESDNSTLVFIEPDRRILRYNPEWKQTKSLRLVEDYRVWGMHSISPDRVLLLTSNPQTGSVEHLRTVSLDDGRTLGILPVKWRLTNTVILGVDGKRYWHGDHTLRVPGYGSIFHLKVPPHIPREELSLIWVGADTYYALRVLDESEVRLLRVNKAGRVLDYLYLNRLLPEGNSFPISFNQQIPVSVDPKGDAYFLAYSRKQCNLMRLAFSSRKPGRDCQ